MKITFQPVVTPNTWKLNGVIDISSVTGKLLAWLCGCEVVYLLPCLGSDC
jgi:hypothetical protein